MTNDAQRPKRRSCYAKSDETTGWWSLFSGLLRSVWYRFNALCANMLDSSAKLDILEPRFQYAVIRMRQLCLPDSHPVGCWHKCLLDAIFYFWSSATPNPCFGGHLAPHANLNSSSDNVRNFYHAVKQYWSSPFPLQHTRTLVSTDKNNGETFSLLQHDVSYALYSISLSSSMVFQMIDQLIHTSIHPYIHTTSS